MDKPDMIFMCGDDKVINGNMIVEVDFDRNPGVWVSFLDGSTRQYNVCSTGILKSYCKEHEIQYVKLNNISNVRPGWDSKEANTNDK